jgi:hypothetical protein
MHAANQRGDVPMNDDHIPVPSEHSFRKYCIQQTETSMTIGEQTNPEAWIQATDESGLMTVRR